MKFAVVDFWLERLTFKLLPKLKPMIVVCNLNCRVPDKVLKIFQIIDNPSGVEEGKYFIIKTKNEVHKGFFLTLLTHKLSPELYSHRSEILQKSLFGYQVSPLCIPDLKCFGKPFQNPKSKTGPKPRNSEVLYLSAFDRVYTESLQKYFKIILSTPSKADKSKSARSQLKNIVEGIITSNQKNFAEVYEFTPDEVTEAIISDLENHDIVTFNQFCAVYNESNIRKYFGQYKCKEMIPKHRVEERSQQVGQSQKDDHIETFDIENIFQLFIQDEKVSKCLTVGEFHYQVCTKLAQILKVPIISVTSKENRLILVEIFQRVLKKCFYCEGVEVDSLVKDIHNHFGKKLTRLIN